MKGGKNERYFQKLSSLNLALAAILIGGRSRSYFWPENSCSQTIWGSIPEFNVYDHRAACVFQHRISHL